VCVRAFPKIEKDVRIARTDVWVLYARKTLLKVFLFVLAYYVIGQ
jgi:hypothetical protein